MGYVDSLAYGILLAAAEAPVAAGRIYWLADERPYPMNEIIDTVRDVLRDDFGMAVKPTTVQVPGIIADVARLADWTLQKAGLYNQEIHVLSEMNLTIACSIERAQSASWVTGRWSICAKACGAASAWCLEQRHHSVGGPITRKAANRATTLKQAGTTAAISKLDENASPTQAKANAIASKTSLPEPIFSCGRSRVSASCA